MGSEALQSYATHRRWVPMYHFVASLLLLLNIGYAGWTLVTGFSFGQVVQFTTAFALLILFAYVRTFPLAAQDRVIRLEERLRLAHLAPDDLRARIDELTVGQLLGLRFASDAELPDLTRRVLDQGIQDREEIKKLIKEWRADTCRV